MTKKQVKNAINKVFKNHRKEMEIEIEDILKNADMWYGDIDSFKHGNFINKNVRNGDILVADGEFDKDVDVNDWLHTRKEFEKFHLTFV